MNEDKSQDIVDYPLLDGPQEWDSEAELQIDNQSHERVEEDEYGLSERAQSLLCVNVGLIGAKTVPAELKATAANHVLAPSQLVDVQAAFGAGFPHQKLGEVR